MGTKKEIEGYIESWKTKGYSNGIPDESPIELERRIIAPSYRSICIALLKNHNNLESIGIKRKKTNIYQELKREEISKRIYNGKQLKLFL